MTDIYFEDIAIGQRFQSEPYEVTESSIVDFARQFDVQPFHLDHAAANESVFDGLSASGWHTAAIAMRLFTTGPLRFAGGVVGLGVDELRWPTAVRPGDRLQLETEILQTRASRSKPQRGLIRIRNVLTNQKGDVVLIYMAHAMVQSRPNKSSSSCG